MRYGGHLGFRGQIMSLHQMDARIGILMVNLPEKVSLHVILGAFIQMFIFQDGVRSYLLFHGLAKKKNGIFARDMEAKFFFIKGPQKSNQSSKHVSQIMVMELTFLDSTIQLVILAPLLTNKVNTFQLLQ